MIRRFSILFLILILSSGCTASNAAQKRSGEGNAATRATATIRDVKPKIYKREKVNTPPPSSETPKPTSGARSASISARARTVSDAVTKLDGIERSSVVITGNTAIVGIETIKKADDAKLAKYKKQIEKTVKDTDDKIDHVTVTAADDLVKRINNMADSVSERSDYPPEYDEKIRELARSIVK